MTRRSFLYLTEMKHGLGLIKGGLKTYIAYPMTPTSPILHYLANLADEFSLKVIHPESEISVMLMATASLIAARRSPSVHRAADSA